MSDHILTLDAAKTWTPEQWKTFVLRRLVNMRTKRWEMEKIWELCDAQVKSESYYDNDGVLNVNIPLEKTLREIYMGRTEGKVNFDIVPDGQANVEDLQPSKYAMNFFLDGNGKDNFWKENKAFRENKSTYWSGIFFTGMRSYKDLRFTLKEGADVTGEGELFNEDNFEQKEHETWFFFPQNIHPRDFYIDDAAYGQNDLQYAQDCIRKEKVSRIDFELRYKDNKAFINIQSALGEEGGADMMPKNENDKSIDQSEYILHHYYHRVTKKYIIIVNEKHIIFEGRYLYEDGKLPFVSAQHYSRDDRFWGEGICERTAWLKAYQSEIWQDILSGAEMNSSVNILTGNDDQIWQDWTVWGRWVNIWRSTWGAEKVQQIGTTINLGYYTAVLDKLDQLSAVISGINPLEQFDPGSDKVGIVEIMESNKSVRNRSVDENYNIALDEAFTHMLSRIKQFAPALLKVDKKDSEGNVIKTIFPKIRIENYEVKKEKGGQVFEEAIGKYGYFDLKPEVVQWVGVKIVTPSTNSVLPILERQKINEYITNIQNLANAFALDQSGEFLNKLRDQINVEDLVWWMSDAYGYDRNGLKANSEKDKILKEIVKKYEALKNVVSINEPTDETNAIAPTGMDAAAPSSISPLGSEMWWSAAALSGVSVWTSDQETATPMMSA